MNTNKTRKLNRNSGFTLIELVVVVGIIGVLIALVAPNVMGSKDGATSALISRSSQSIASNINVLAQACGVSTDTTATAIVATPTTNLIKLIMGGTNGTTGVALATGYTNCYKQSSVAPLSDMGQFSTAGGWKIGNYAVSLAGGGSAPIQVIYTGVTDSVAGMIYSKIDPDTTFAATAMVISNVIDVSASVAGLRTVKIYRQTN